MSSAGFVQMIRPGEKWRLSSQVGDGLRENLE